MCVLALIFWENVCAFVVGVGVGVCVRVCLTHNTQRVVVLE